MIWLIVLAAQARDFTLEVSTPLGCPGPQDIQVSGVPPNSRVQLFTASETAGGAYFHGCFPTWTHIGPADLTRRMRTRADARGEVFRSFHLYAGDCGTVLQALNPDTCAMSNVVLQGFEPEPLTCACDALLSTGDRVVALADEAGGAPGLLADTAGTVLAAGADDTALVAWDAWTDGHGGECDLATCGTCADTGDTNRYWVPCDELGHPSLGCVPDRHEPNETIDTATVWMG